MPRKAWWLPVYTRKFLGYRIDERGILRIAKQSIERIKSKLRAITKRNRGSSLEEVIKDINTLVPGWARYFGYAQSLSTIGKLDEWLRHKLRCYKLKQLKRPKTIARTLMKRGIGDSSAWALATSGKGWWRKSLSPQMHRAFGIGWWKINGLISFTRAFESL